MAFREQNFDYFLVLDFEATCIKDGKLTPQEIIEFPVVKVNAKNFEIEAQFHQYVKPEVHSKLSPFCTELTGIVQEQVNDQPNLSSTLETFHKWMQDEGLLQSDVRSIFVTCGDWDLKTMLPQQCQYFNLQAPPYLSNWINIKKTFCEVTGKKPKAKGDLIDMLDVLGLKHVGRYHSGIDDCRNIANILKELAQRGYLYKA